MSGGAALGTGQEDRQSTERASDVGQSQDRERSNNAELKGTVCGDGGCGPCNDCAIEVDTAVAEAIATDDLEALIESAKNSAAHAAEVSESYKSGDSIVIVTDHNGAIQHEVRVNNAEAIGAGPGGASIAQSIAATLLNALRGNAEVAQVIPPVSAKDVPTSPGFTEGGSRASSPGGVMQRTSDLVSVIGRVASYATNTQSSYEAKSTAHAAASLGNKSAPATPDTRVTGERSSASPRLTEQSSKVDSARSEGGRLITQQVTSASQPVATLQKVILQEERRETPGVKNAAATATSQQVSPELRRVVASLIAVEKTIQESRPPAVVQQVLQKLSQVSLAASASSPALSAVAQRVNLLTNMVKSTQQPTQLSVRVVQQQLPVVRDMLVKMLPSQPQPSVNKSVALSAPSRVVAPQVQPVSPNVRGIDSRVSSPVDRGISRNVSTQAKDIAPRIRGEISTTSRVSQIPSRVAELGKSRVRAGVDRPLDGKTTAKITVKENPSLTRSHSLKRRGGNETRTIKKSTEVATRAAKLRTLNKEALRNRKVAKLEVAKRKEQGQKLQRLSPREKFSKEMRRELRTTRKVEDFRSAKRLKDAVARLRARRLSPQKRTVERGARERLTLRRKPLSARSQEVIQQQELAKKLSKTMKKLLREGDDELLGLLSPMEQRLIKNLSKKLDAAATINDLQKNLKKARKQKGGVRSSATEVRTEAKGDSSTAGTVTSQTKGATTQQTSAPEGAQPSKSLDLVTDKIGDGNNKNGYQAGMGYSPL